MLRNIPAAAELNQEQASDPVFLLHADLALRHQLVANILDIDLPASAMHWYESSTNQLQSLLEDHLNEPVTVHDARTICNDIGQKVTAFRQQSSVSGRRPLVISLDPVFARPDSVDYTFQQARVSVVTDSNPYIDLENNPRGYANRFASPSGNNNGAGKLIATQSLEIDNLIRATEQPTDIAIVEDYANSGKSIVEHFAHLAQDARNSITVITGHLNASAAKNFAEYGIVPLATHAFDRSPERYMDQTDLLPTLGGRSIGRNFLQTIIPHTIDFPGISTPVAVDAITGNYPWQVDLTTQDMTADFARDMNDLSLDVARTFWTSLEAAKGMPLAWSDLLPLNGIARIFYPMRDKQSVHMPADELAGGPREAIDEIRKTVW